MDFLYRARGLSAWVSSLLLLGSLSQPGVSAARSSPEAILDNGLQDEIKWDRHSIIIGGDRLFLFGGEMHPFRLPVPELWEDILQKIKALGMRHVSIYTHWGFHAPTPDKADFSTGAHNITHFLETAKNVGLYVTVRPGPYINAETNAGGLALWATTGEHGSLRLNDTAFTEAWTPYQDGIAQLTRPFQLTEDGTVIMYQIENEYGEQWVDAEAKIPNPAAVSYMEALEDNARRNGIVVPLIHNSPNLNSPVWSKDYDTVGAGGNVDIYGVDNYPQCWSCDLEECTNVTPWAVFNYFDHFESVSPYQPSLMPEFQGGSYNPWLGPAGACRDRTGVDFVNFYYRDNIAQKVSILTLYTIFGGTNWGWLAAPFIGTSYDYGAAISEDRSIDDKYYEIKNLGLFTRVADELALTDRVGTGVEYTNNTNLFVTELRNPDTGAGFYFIRHDETASDSEEWFALQVNTSIGEFYVPKIGSAVVLSGHEGKILVTDFHFGKHTLYYATAEVLTYSIIDNEKTVLVLWTPSGRSGEFFLKGAKEGKISSGPPVTLVAEDEGIIVAYIQKDERTIVELDNGVTVVLVDRATAYKTWVPALTDDPKVPANQTAVVIGPYLVRSATLTDTTISLQGDFDAVTPLEVFTSSHITGIRWNDVDLPTTRSNHSTLVATVPAPPYFYTPAKIVSWKYHDALPERFPNYTDTGPAWVLANRTTTPNPAVDPDDVTKPFLFADEYGFHTGIRLWRGHFTVSSADDNAPTGVYLNVQGGTAHGWSAYLNGVFLGSWLGEADAGTGNRTLSFSSGDDDKDSSNGAGLVKEGDNVLLLIHDDTGHDQRDAAINPRGVLNATLLGGGGGNAGKKLEFTSWKVAGTAGGSAPERAGLDTVRTHYNEGGLAAERLGWHLPGFDDSDWEVGRGPAEGFTGAGVRFYRGRTTLDVPPGIDLSLAFRFTPAEEDVEKGTLGYRVLLFVNGWQYARYYPSIASEDTFPVPPGVFDYSTTNLITVAVWSLQEEGARVDIDLVVRYAVGSSLNINFDGKYLQPGWDPVRLEYA
ncbi:glycoside hydrolase superfamily [Corynascus novoguineensis]|uniref:beta-galactosidase n=1 Tax=Corynascus novoguineensis TaxID=1126955 RepID=A0AAN7CQC7_9PEZI|nr:glycoside hydrolase superfamily [Corynascus novoguineensis]